MVYSNMPVLGIFSKAACRRHIPVAVKHGSVPVCFLPPGSELAHVDAECCLILTLGAVPGEAAEIAGL